MFCSTCVRPFNQCSYRYMWTNDHLLIISNDHFVQTKGNKNQIKHKHLISSTLFHAATVHCSFELLITKKNIYTNRKLDTNELTNGR